MVKVSVVVPIYNVEEYLEECLNSILGQTYPNLEILCINDGSKDNGGKILSEYAEKDQRITVVNKDNTGYGHSVNIGIDMAKGEYIAIVEPDDYIDSHMIENLLKIAISKDVDFVKSNYKLFWGEGKSRTFSLQKLYLQEDLYNKIICPLEDVRTFHGCIANWAGLYRKDFLDSYHIRHNETPGASYQDQGFNFLLYVFAQKIYVSDKDYYRYRQDNPSSSMANKEKVFCIVDEYKYIYKTLCESDLNKKDWSPIFFKRKFVAYRGTLGRIAKEFKKEFLLYMLKELKEEFKKGELKREYLTQTELEEIDAMMESPETYLEHNEIYSRDINEVLEHYDTVWIYGGGNIAHELWNRLDDNSRTKIKGFFVTRIDKQYEDMPRKVIEFSKEKYFEEDLILVAVSYTFMGEIKETLKNAGCSKYYMARKFL